MLKNYLKISLRTLKRQKVFALINIVGLAVALACCLLILFHVKDELSYEQGFSKADQLHRVTTLSQYGDTSIHWAPGSPPLGPMIAAEVPEINHFARFRRIPSTVLSFTPGQGDVKRFREPGGFYADAAALELFDLTFLQGDSQTALEAVDAVVLTASMAARYFGADNPIGKTLSSDVAGRLYQITGIIEDIPANTHLQFDFLVSMATWYQLRDERYLNSRTWKALYTYVLLDERYEKTAVESKIEDFRIRSFHRELPERKEMFLLQPIVDIHLHSKLEYELGPNSDIAYIYIFAMSGVLLLLIAVINFVNLTTAKALRRLREVGIRKAIGAHRTQLVHQFLEESFLHMLLASGLALMLFGLALPFYNTLSGKQFTFMEVLSLENVALVFVIVLVTGLCAGLYPAFFISRFGPVQALKEQKTPGSSASMLKKGLVVFQFAITVFLICCTITIYKQLVFLQEKDLGFDQEQLIAVELYGDDVLNNIEALKWEILKQAAITHVSVASDLPGDPISVDHFRPKSISEAVGLPLVTLAWADEHFLETMGIQLKEGRTFRPPKGEEEQFLISETAVEVLGLANPVGQKAGGYPPDGEIVGVFSDFHYASLHNVIEPLVLIYKPNAMPYLLVRFESVSTPEVLTYIEEQIKAVSPNYFFDYTFVDDKLSQLYVFEDRLEVIFQFFSGIALLIACLGLFGLSVFAAELRRKELGIRKVLGASVLGINGLFSKEFMTLVVVANVVAWPLAYFALRAWLQGFAYRLEVEVTTFVVAALVSVLIALLTISYQSVKAARANPIDSLMYE